jgi:hexokinase
MTSSRTDQNLLENAKTLTQSLVISDDNLRKIMSLLESEFKKGLKGDEKAVVRMFITYVRSLPNTKEYGRYLALDLGGTSFRVILIELNEKEVKMNSDVFAIPKVLMRSEGEKLFDFIADSIITFTAKHNLERVQIALGFTFSFPCVQFGLSEAKLISWTKGFNCSGVVGRDVVKCLKDALKRKSHICNAYVDIVALINDTTGTLMSCAHKDSNCNIGIIVGTGFNSCYLEKLDNIEKWPSNYTEPKQVIINTEWGAFGDNQVIDFVKTEWDSLLDSQSINIGKQTYEKMVSGMYLGELVRFVLLSLIKAKILFNGVVPNKLLEKNSFPTKYVSKIDSDNRRGFPVIKQLMSKEFEKNDCTDTDLHIISMATNRVSRRAANLVSVGCATLLERMKRQQSTIGYDGSVVRFHPFFVKWINEKISQLIGPTISYKLMLSEDGSGRGAAIVAAVSYKEKRPKIIKRNGKVYEIGTFIH